MPTRERAQIDALTSYRGLAAAMVLLYHMQLFGLLPKNLWLVRYGFAGVGLFFALSGFLFTILYFGQARLEPAFLTQYFLKRVIRIYPLYFTILLLGVLTGNSKGFLDVLTHATMTHGYFRDFRFSINTPMWTLSIEEAFYLSLPFLLVLLAGLERRFRLTQRPTRALLAGAAFLGLSAAVLLGAGKALHGLVRPDDDWFRGTLFGRFSEFAVGMLCGLFVLKFPQSRWLSDRRLSTALGFLGLLLFVSVSFLIELNVRGDQVPAWTKNIKVLYAVSGGLLILALQRRSYWNLLFDQPVAVYLGKISFALYLCQYLGFAKDRTLLQSIAEAWPPLRTHPAPAAFLVFALFIGIAAALFHLVEHPAQKYLRGLLSHRPATPMTAHQTAEAG